jgi:transcriptional regulator with XRE-family HTH domain
MLKDQIFAALRRAYEEAGTQEELQKKTGVSRAQIARLLSGERSCGKIYAETLERLFPKMAVYLYPDEQPCSNNSATIPDAITRRVVHLMSDLDEDGKAECLELVAAAATVHRIKNKRKTSPPEAQEKSSLAG